MPVRRWRPAVALQHPGRRDYPVATAGIIISASRRARCSPPWSRIMPRQPNLPGRIAAGALLIALGGVGSAHRAGVPADVRPSLAPIIPLGAQRGTALDLILSGANLADPRALGQIPANYVTILPNLPAGKDSTKIRARLEVPADAQLGWYRLRVLTDGGLSN